MTKTDSVCFHRRARVRVYLDSSDYSTLSNPGLSDHLATCCTRLFELSNAGLLRMYFSSAHISEMSPLEAQFVDAAVRRANLLGSLCGRNALLSLDQLLAGELRFAHGLASVLPDAQALNGDWFPGGVASISPVAKIDVSETVGEVISEAAPNRKTRRQAERRFLKNGQIRAAFRSSLLTNARIASLDDILSSYPIRPQDARVLARFAVGDATEEEAQHAFVESLRDPAWMMMWYRDHHAKLTPFVEWTRSPGRVLHAATEEMASHVAMLRRDENSHRVASSGTLPSAEGWRHSQDELLVHLAERLTRALLGLELPALSVERIDAACPGLSVGVRSLHSALWTSTLATPRKSKPSDLPDALHAMYAPYVDVFRADTFMAPYIDTYARRFGTLVVSKLSDLLPQVESRLNSDD